MKVLNLTLTREWFEMIASGEKKDEYREIKPFWFQRLVFQYEKVFKYNTGYDYKEGLYLKEGVEHSCSKERRSMMGFRPFDVVRFKNGYRNDARVMELRCEGIAIGYGKPEWGATFDEEYFVIKLGEKIK